MCANPALADALATNLKKCATRHPRCSSAAKARGRRPGSPRLPGPSPAGARPRNRVSCTFFSVCCAIAGQLGSIRDGSGRLQRPFSISSFVIVRLTCGFPRRGQGRGASGAPAPATSRKKCARNGAIADKRATNRKKCAAGRPRLRRSLHAKDAAGAPARPPAACDPRAPAGRSRPQPAASRTKPAPIAAGRGRVQLARSLRVRHALDLHARRFVEVS